MDKNIPLDQNILLEVVYQKPGVKLSETTRIASHTTCTYGEVKEKVLELFNSQESIQTGDVNVTITKLDSNYDPIKIPDDKLNIGETFGMWVGIPVYKDKSTGNPVFELTTQEQKAWAMGIIEDGINAFTCK